VTSAARLWGCPFEGISNRFVTPSLNDTQSVRAHKQMRSMVEVAFLDRFESRGKERNQNNQHSSLDGRI
jgi:hypothetical protein